MQTINEPTHPTDYRLVKLMDGSLLIGTISVDENHMRIVNPLEMITTPRMTEFGLKEDSTLCRWIPFTQDKEFLIAKDKIVVISLASVELAHYYEVVLDKIETTDAAIKGQTASSSYKPATLENGIKIMVPPFINPDDVIVLDTRTLEYVKKLKK